MRRVAIVGAGIGAQHAAGFAAAPGWQVATVCDLDPTRGGALAEASGAAYAARLEEVLADPGIDVVDICLPPHLHLNACVAAMEAGKAVICEKPLVTSLAECDRLEEVSRATGQPVFPVFQYRYGTGTAQLRAVIQAGLAGAPLAAALETHWSRDAAYYAVPWRGTWAGERGGCVVTHAIHIHDLVSWVMGPVARVQGALTTRVNKIETEDCAALALTLEGGALITSSVTLGGAGDHSRLRLVYEGVTVTSDTAPYAPAAAPWRFEARGPVTQAQVDEVLAGVPDAAPGYAGLFTAIGAALDGEGGAEVTLADGRRALELITAIYGAARSGRAEDLPLNRLHPLYESWLPKEHR